MTDKITQNQFFQLLGLITAAQQLSRRLMDIETASRDITGDDLGGHIADLMWDADSAVTPDLLREKLGYMKIAI